jgi:DNA repair exonuclease SbcCD ATPase subunit
MNTNPRVTASCRIPPQLKKALERDAQELELTTSHYLEQLIVSRHDDDSDITSRDLEVLSNNVSQLKFDNQILENQLEEKDIVYVNDVAELNQRIKSLKAENEYLTHQNSLLRPLKEKVSDLNSDNAGLTQDIEDLSNKLDILENQFPFQLDASDKEKLKTYLYELSEYYPDAPMNLLLLGSLNTTIRTEKAHFNIPLISKFLNQYQISQS